MVLYRKTIRGILLKFKSLLEFENILAQDTHDVASGCSGGTAVVSRPCNKLV